MQFYFRTYAFNANSIVMAFYANHVVMRTKWHEREVYQFTPDAVRVHTCDEDYVDAEKYEYAKREEMFV